MLMKEKKEKKEEPLRGQCRSAGRRLHQEAKDAPLPSFGVERL